MPRRPSVTEAIRPQEKKDRKKKKKKKQKNIAIGGLVDHEEKEKEKEIEIHDDEECHRMLMLKSQSYRRPSTTEPIRPNNSNRLTVSESDLPNDAWLHNNDGVTTASPSASNAVSLSPGISHMTCSSATTNMQPSTTTITTAAADQVSITGHNLIFVTQQEENITWVSSKQQQEEEGEEQQEQGNHQSNGFPFRLCHHESNVIINNEDSMWLFQDENEDEDVDFNSKIKKAQLAEEERDRQGDTTTLLSEESETNEESKTSSSLNFAFTTSNVRIDKPYTVGRVADNDYMVERNDNGDLISTDDSTGRNWGRRSTASTIADDSTLFVSPSSRHLSLNISALAEEALQEHPSNIKPGNIATRRISSSGSNEISAADFSDSDESDEESEKRCSDKTKDNGRFHQWSLRRSHHSTASSHTSGHDDDDLGVAAPSKQASSSTKSSFRRDAFGRSNGRFFNRRRRRQALHWNEMLENRRKMLTGQIYWIPGKVHSIRTRLVNHTARTAKARKENVAAIVAAATSSLMNRNQRKSTDTTTSPVTTYSARMRPRQHMYNTDITSDITTSRDLEELKKVLEVRIRNFRPDRVENFTIRRKGVVAFEFNAIVFDWDATQKLTTTAIISKHHLCKQRRRRRRDHHNRPFRRRSSCGNGDQQSTAAAAASIVAAAADAADTNQMEASTATCMEYDEAFEESDDDDEGEFEGVLMHCTLYRSHLSSKNQELVEWFDRLQHHLHKKTSVQVEWTDFGTIEMTQMIAAPYFLLEDKTPTLYAMIDKFIWAAVVAQEKLNEKSKKKRKRKFKFEKRRIVGRGKRFLWLGH